MAETFIYFLLMQNFNSQQKALNYTWPRKCTAKNVTQYFKPSETSQCASRSTTPVVSLLRPGPYTVKIALKYNQCRCDINAELFRPINKSSCCYIWDSRCNKLVAAYLKQSCNETKILGVRKKLYVEYVLFNTFYSINYNFTYIHICFAFSYLCH